MPKLDPISYFLSPLSCDSLVFQGLRCEWGAGVFNVVLSLSLSHTGHWKFNMAPHGKELSEDLKKIIVVLHKDGVGYKKIAKTQKLSCSTVFKSIQRFNTTGSTQNSPRHARPKKLSARAQRHIAKYWNASVLKRIVLGQADFIIQLIDADMSRQGTEILNMSILNYYCSSWQTH